MTAQSQTPQPMPLPAPPLSLPPPSSTARPRRHRTSSSSSNSSTITSFSSSSSSSPAPSPRTTNTYIPFSWEHHPGIPKNSLPGLASSSTTVPVPLPLPPALRQVPRSRRRRTDVLTSHPDPFAAAFAECTKDCTAAAADVMDKLWPAPATSILPTERRWWVAGCAAAGFLDLYGCKSTIDVADSAFLARQPVAARARARPSRAGPKISIKT